MTEQAGHSRVIERDTRRYLESGEVDLLFPGWPGEDLLEAAREGTRALKKALLGEVERRAAGRRPPDLPAGLDLESFARRKLAPMVEGLFAPGERRVVLDLLERSVVFLTSESIGRLIMDPDCWLSTARDLANIYLGSLGAEPLAGDRAHIVGLSEGTRCYVSATYFKEEDPYADFVVHEAAHVFHNWKREHTGLPFTRKCEWLLPIEFSRRETFAYACEAYSRIVEGTRRPKERRERLADYAEKHMPSGIEDSGELVAILTEAVKAKNGWRRILARCSYL